MMILRPTIGAALALASFASAQQPTIHAYYETDTQGLKITAQVAGASGPGFVFTALPLDAAGAPISPTGLPIATGLLDAQGNGFASAIVTAKQLARLQGRVQLVAQYLAPNNQIVTSAPAALELGLPQTTCETLDFDFTIGDDSGQVAGAVMTDQWDDIGMAISGDNARPAGPDQLILFDSANPTGGDFDLQTPNPAGFNNTQALGQLLIIGENDIDANNDGLVDVPDDEAAGGSLYFDFAGPITLCSVTLVDVDDDPGTELRFYRTSTGGPTTTIPVVSLGDGSVQTILFQEDQVDRFEVFFSGSGAVASVELDPCPTQLNFDETPTGEPRNLPAGTIVDGSNFADLGVTISGTNNTPGNPDEVILFDTLNPTGGDFDLMTPNPAAPGNTEPLGLVLIIAENIIDLDMDGLVDDPDDEAGGGTIRIEWSEDITFFSTRVLDVDGVEIDTLRLFDNNNTLLFSQVIPNVAIDGAVQTVTGGPNGVSGVRVLELELGGSGALSRIRYCPDRLLPPPVTVPPVGTSND